MSGPLRNTRHEAFAKALFERPRTGMTLAQCYESAGYKTKGPGANFSAVKKSDRRPPVDAASITLPRSSVSLSSGDEVPHIFTRKSRVQPKEILITSAKGLLQQHRPQAVISPIKIPQRSKP